ncbi:MAG: HD domain-containing protein [Thermoplasmatales archaeon]
MNKFDPGDVLRKLELNKKIGKTHPPETLFWHSLNVYRCAETLAEVIPVPLNDSESRILKWSALLHDAGKMTAEWQSEGRGPHVPDEITIERIKAVIEEETNSDMILSKEEEEKVIEFIKEHHTRHTLSDAGTERIIKILKLADRLVSQTTIDSGLVEEVDNFLYPNYSALVLTAEDHPISYYALALADGFIEEPQTEYHGQVKLLVVNRFQSLYLLKEGVNRADFKNKVCEHIEDRILAILEERDFLNNPYGKKPGNSLKGSAEEFIFKVHKDKSRIIDEFSKKLDNLNKNFQKSKAKGIQVDEFDVWRGPFNVLLKVSIDYGLKKNLIGTPITIESVKGNGNSPPPKDSIKMVADYLNAKTPEEFIDKVIDVIKNNTSPSPDKLPHIKNPSTNEIDFLHWNDEPLDIKTRANEVYEFYRENLWNDSTHKRQVREYCFSCKRRKATREAPTTKYMKTDTWTSSQVEKSKVWVCDLCYIAWRLNEMNWSPKGGRFHLDATPNYNHARVEWKDVFYQGLSSKDWSTFYTFSHEVVFPLRAETPNDALTEVLKYNSGNKEYPFLIDFLFKNGLNATVGAGPRNSGEYLLDGCGLHVGFSEWESYGDAMKLLESTKIQEVLPVVSTWRELTQGFGWGTLLAVRHRRGKLKSKENAEVINNLIKIKSQGSDKMFEEVGGLPLWMNDWDKRFKSAERIIRRMDRVTMVASAHRDKYGGTDQEIVDIIANNGLKQWRSEVIKNSEKGQLLATNERMSQVKGIFHSIARRMWDLRNSHGARRDFVNAVVIAIAYNPKKEA